MLLSQPLQRFIDGLLDELAPALREAAEAAHEALRTAGHPACSNLPREAVGEAAELFAHRRLQWVQAMLQALRFEARHAAIDAGAQWAADPGPTTAPMDEWSLVDEDQAEADIEALRTVQLLRNEAEAELRELQALLSSLRGFTEIHPQANPVSAEAVSQALWTAVEGCGLQGPARLAAVRALAPRLAIEMKAAWARAVQALLRRGVEPAAYRAVPTPSARREDPPQTSFDLTRPGALEQLMSAHWAHRQGSAGQDGPPPPAAAGGDGTAPALPGRLAGEAPAAVMPAGRERDAGAAVPSVLGLIRSAQAQARLEAALDALPPTSGNLVRLHEAALMAAARDDRDREVMALIGRLFDHLLEDPHLLPPLQALVARLQPAVLRAALDDEGLVEDPRHPLWRLLDALGSHAAGWAELDAAGTAQAQHFVAAAEPVLQPLLQPSTSPASQPAGPAPRPTLHQAADQALAALQGLIAQEQEAAVRAAGPVIERLHRAAERDRAVRLLRQRVSLHEAGHGRLEPTLRAFFSGLWMRVVAAAALLGGEAAAEPWLDLADELLHSLRPPAHGLERRQRLERLPDLLQRLQAGLDRIDAPQSARQAVLDALMARHTELLREAQPAAGLADTAAPPAPAPVLDWAPTDPAVWSARRGDTVIDEAGLDTVPAELLPAPGADPGEPLAAAPALTGLPIGTWLRLHLRGDWRVLRLLWRDAAGQQLVLGPGLTAAPLGAPVEPAAALTARALQRLALAGLAAPLESRSLLERAVDAVLASMGRAGARLSR